MFQVDLPVLCETEAFCIRSASYTLDIDVNNQTFSYHSVVQCLAESDVDSWSLRYERNVVGYSMLVELETDVSACSADFIAEEMSGVFECESKEEKCVCRTKNVLLVCVC